MSSNRPETSIPATSSEAASTDNEESGAFNAQKSYTPNVVDIVMPAGRAHIVMDGSIPPEFLQSDAVDSSVLIGQGASFTVSRQSLPRGPDKLFQTTIMNGWTVTKEFDAPKRPSYIVYKSARVCFQPDGDPVTTRDSRAMLSVLTEMHALLQPPLRRHPNVITLLALAWGSNHADPFHRLPVLVVEYGNKGTLAAILSDSKFLSKKIKNTLCTGIAHGLRVLHEQGIVHGDLKPDNVIMCSGEDGELIPKLADFGFAVIESDETASIHIGGTRTWRAPESFGPVPVKRLKLTDIYSFGLVVWSVMAQMNDPFSLVTSKLDPLEEYLTEIDRLKMKDIVVEITQLKNWCIPWMLRTHRVLQGSEIDSQGPPPQSSQLIPSRRERLENTTAIQRQDLYSAMLSSPAHKKRLWSWLPRHLDSIFKCTLTKDPTKRDLEATIKFLESDQIDPPLSIRNLDLSTIKVKDESTHIANSQAAESEFHNRPSALLDQRSKVRYKVTNNTGRDAAFRFTGNTRQDTSFPKVQQEQPGSAAKIDWAKLGFKSHRYSWQNIRDLEPGVQKFVVKCLSHVDDPADAACDFILSGCLVNAYGIGFDAQKAIDHMVRSARNGHAGARANLYRMSVTCGKSLGPDVPVAHYLKEAVRNGSRSALQDLIQLRRQEGIDEWKLLRYAYAGVGADWYCQRNWLYGLDQPSFLNTDFDIRRLGEIADLPHLIVNIRGDGIIHAAAALGACSFLEPLLKDSILDINQQNAHGETAILCACRSGHSDMVKLLLDHEADASLQALNGESPLHWLSSFDPNSINTSLVGQDLITRGGAKVDAVTTERISHSGTYRSIDVDFQMPGTPLAWAVHDNNPQAVAFLLSQGANPNICPEGAAISPLE